MARLIKRLFFRLTVVALILMLAGVCYSIYVVSKAPKTDFLDAAPKNYRSYVLDDTGNIVLTLCGQESNRVYVQLAEVPLELQRAFVAIEDERFYRHNGIDLRGIARAVYRGIKAGGLSQGASTITQQLIKNNVLTTWTEEKTFQEKLERKIQEMYLAIQLEREVSKDWILENYLNTINLGGGNWGVETAARYYFDKDISQLNLSECAVLAAITKNPTTYNPARNPEKNAERRGYVLDKMVELGYISDEEREEALNDPVYDRITEVRATGSSPEIMTYFEDALIYQLVADLKAAGHSEEEAWNMLYQGGLTIYSTESSAIQEYCERAAKDDGLYDSDAQISMVVMENENGYVKALVGGRGEKEGSLLFNRATSAVRQPGSVIKILGEYAAGFESGSLTLGTTFDDAPYEYSNGTSIVNANGKYGGETTIRSAIAASNNIVALKSFQLLGMSEVWNQLMRFGITTLTDADKVEALALGGTSGGVTNLEMTAAYCAIARGGSYIEPVYYTRVVDRTGKVVLENVQETHEAVSAGTAAMLTTAMQEVMKSGTGVTANYKGMTLAGKSGTTSGIRDAWFVGFSPYYTCGVWGGYDDNSTQPSSKYVQAVWKEIMRDSNAPREDVGFQVTVPEVTCDICIKCGKLAVKDLCDHTMQGDMTREEVYLQGTQPVSYCDCHVKVKICNDSGEIAGNYCPSTHEYIYLAKGTEGTDDEAYVLPSRYAGQDTCRTHTNIWQYWFGSWGHRNDDADVAPNPDGSWDSDDGSYGGYGSEGRDSYTGDAYGRSDSNEDSGWNGYSENNTGRGSSQGSSGSGNGRSSWGEQLGEAGRSAWEGIKQGVNGFVDDIVDYWS